METYIQSVNVRLTSEQNEDIPGRNNENVARKGTEYFYGGKNHSTTATSLENLIFFKFSVHSIWFLRRRIA